ncbi:protein SON-like isoform X2 [Acanthaster planci]|uniref:Protein SON-like isoform X2 n=1 Tax=Acanthaster planci TaxID=133434 RepID=A0A8B7Y9Q1_ACAPL|nr:protein SON-like isoform X2 [Acanthaster planci]XP_022089964.1 protein SON-like isoform X2 [Acanthaster planci]XP_022089965.1 protein SON-like isoform X2 [Acanthaster planci]
MADLQEVLRTFALKKMQELKQERGDEEEMETGLTFGNENGDQQSDTITGKSKLKQNNLRGKDEIKTASSNREDGTLSDVDKISETPPKVDNNEIDANAQMESKSIKTEPSGGKDGKDKKITIKLLTTKIDPETVMLKDEMAEVGEEKDEDEESISDSSDDANEGQVSDGKPWRKVYEEGELSPSSDSGEEGEEETNVAKEEEVVNSETSGEIKDEDAKKSKKHKKHKHKKHKHSKDKTKEESTKIKDKHKSKKDKKKDKERKEHKSKDKEKDGNRERSKDKKKSKDKKASKEDVKQDKQEDNDSEMMKHKEKSEKKHKSKHKDKGSDSKGEKSSGGTKRKHRSGSRSRSRSRSKSKSTSHHKKHKRSKSRSRSPKSHKHSHSTRSRSRDRLNYHSTSPERYYSRRYNSGFRYRNRSRSRSRSPHSDEFKIDKAKLLEIAKANAYAKMQSGEFPPYMKLTPKSVVTKVDPKEGRSVEELTAVCKEIASKQQDSSDSDESPINKPVGSDDESDEPFIRHPFKVREAPLGNVGIVMNIKNAIQKPIQDKEMLRITFPVSSGSQHRKKEDEMGSKPYGDWVAVEKKPKMMDPVAKPTTKIMLTQGTSTLTPTASTGTPVVPGVGAAPSDTVASAAMPPPPVPPLPITPNPPLLAAAQAPVAAAPSPVTAAPSPVAAAPSPVAAAPSRVAAAPAQVAATPVPVAAVPPPAPLTFAGIISPAGALPTSSAIAAASATPAGAAAAEFAAAAAVAVSKAAAAAAAPTPIGVAATPPAGQKDEPKDDRVFEEIPNQKVDIAAMVSARLKATRRLESNPNDIEALSLMHKAQTQIRNWTVGKQKPGMFTGDTGIRPLRPEELANTDPRAQAWAKRAKHHPDLCSSRGKSGRSPNATAMRLE